MVSKLGSHIISLDILIVVTAAPIARCTDDGTHFNETHIVVDKDRPPAYWNAPHAVSFRNSGCCSMNFIIYSIILVFDSTLAFCFSSRIDQSCSAHCADVQIFPREIKEQLYKNCGPHCFI